MFDGERLERLAGHVRSFGGGLPRWEVEDVVQETLLRALSSGHAPNGPSEEYVIGIARHVILDSFRHRRRVRSSAEPWGSSRLHEAPAQDPHESALVLREMLRRARTWIARQPPAVRRLYQRRFDLGESQRNAARALGLSHQQLRTVEGRLRRDLRRVFTSSTLPVFKKRQHN